MKFKLLFSFLFAGALTLSAQQGYKDGIEYFRADQPEEAEIILNRTINDAGTDKAEAYYYLGQIELQKGNVAAAKEDFNKGIQINGQNPKNYIGLGMIDLKNGNKAGAEAQFKAARDIDKKNPLVAVEIARAYFNADPALYAKEIAKNIAQAKNLSKKQPEPAIYILEADMLAPTNVGEAAGYYEMASQFDPNTNYPEAYVKYARTYFTVNPQYSIDKLKALLEKQPNSALAQRELAEKYYESDRLTLAAEQYGNYIANPNHFQKDKIRYVALLYFGKKYQESFDLASQILVDDPNNIYMQRMQFLNMEALKQPIEAKKYAEAFFNNPAAEGKIVPNDYTTYGDVLSELGQDTLAAVQFEKAVDLAPEKVALLKDLSGAYTKAKMYREAAEAYRKYCETDEATTNDIFMLARRYQNVAATEAPDSPEKAEAVDNALRYVNIALERVPDNATIALTKARILFVRNNNVPDQDTVDAYLEGLALLDKDEANKTKRKSDYVNAYNQIANFYLNQKDMENAKLYFNKFLEIDPENAALRQFVENLK
ncbi:MAG: tetratricopeptide repeat protein [Muribaculaceae bacterium]|nr:tetratricopeptide repeat protein [Muribaculaceae bacterium]MDE6644234.1 tetratricopeptide repeat protein [Muribaculaceae bacterium]